MRLSSLLRDFLESLEVEKNRSPKTIQNYEFYLGRFLAWLGDKKPADINAEAVRKYRLWLNRLVDIHGDPLKKNTQNYHLIALRAFLKYLAKRDLKILPPEKIELMKLPDREVSFLEGSDLNRILESPILNLKPKTSKLKPLVSLRDKAILELLFSTGLRVSELANLKRENINLNKEEFTVTGKGRKSRVVFLSEQARYWLKKYLEARSDLNPYLFIAHEIKSNKMQSSQNPPPSRGRRGGGYENKKNDRPLTPRSIQRLVQKYARAAGITKPVTPHTLRHSYATDLLQNGADIRSVQAMLGHSSITTTQIYTHITDKELRQVHKRFHGKKRGGD